MCSNLIEVLPGILSDRLRETTETFRQERLCSGKQKLEKGVINALHATQTNAECRMQNADDYILRCHDSILGIPITSLRATFFTACPVKCVLDYVTSEMQSLN
jgi:hypothetical protein